MRPFQKAQYPQWYCARSNDIVIYIITTKPYVPGSEWAWGGTRRKPQHKPRSQCTSQCGWWDNLKWFEMTIISHLCNKCDVWHVLHKAEWVSLYPLDRPVQQDWHISVMLPWIPAGGSMEHNSRIEVRGEKICLMRREWRTVQELDYVVPGTLFATHIPRVSKKPLSRTPINKIFHTSMNDRS